MYSLKTEDQPEKRNYALWRIVCLRITNQKIPKDEFKIFRILAFQICLMLRVCYLLNSFFSQLSAPGLWLFLRKRTHFFLSHGMYKDGRQNMDLLTCQTSKKNFKPGRFGDTKALVLSTFLYYSNSLLAYIHGRALMLLHEIGYIWGLYGRI